MTDDSDAGDFEAVPSVDRSFLDDVIDERDARGFVAVGEGVDDDLRYLMGFDDPSDHYAYVRVGGADGLCPPATAVGHASRQFDGEIWSERLTDHPGERAAAVLDSSRESSSESDSDAEHPAHSSVVLVPPTIPHDAAVYLERAGYELRSTTAVADARATKTGAEVDAVRAVQRAAERGVRRGERVLAVSEFDTGSEDGDELLWDGAPLTAERLRREVNVELSRHGVTDAGNTAVHVGTSTGSEAAADRIVHRGEAIVLDVAPRSPHGYHGHLSRTLVVDSDGGWERRAYVACEAAIEAALGEVEPGADVDDVRREATAELAAFGFDPGSGDGGPSDTSPAAETVHGVGLTRRERPRARSGATLEPGVVLAVTPSVSDPDSGTVRLSELVVVTTDRHERVGEGTASFTPRE